MSEEEKQPYVDMGKDDRDRYETEKAEWESKRIKKIREKKEIVRARIAEAKIAQSRDCCKTFLDKSRTTSS